MPKKLDFPIIVELARSLMKEIHGRSLHDAEVGGLQCVWQNIDYQEYENNSRKFTVNYSQCYRFPEKTKKAATLVSSVSRVLNVFSKKFDRKLTRHNFRRNIQELWDENQIDISTLNLKLIEIEERDEESPVIEGKNKESPLIEEVIEQNVQVVDSGKSPLLIERNVDIQYVQTLLEQYSILFLYGAPGIGKTTLANQLGKYLENQYTIYYSDLRYIDDFRQWGYEILSQAKISEDIDSNRIIAKLLETLESKSSLVFIDSVSFLDREFSGFFETISLRNKQSAQFILMSTQKININISSQYLHFERLNGLTLPEDINKFYKSLGLKSSNYWDQMNQFYRGNFRQIIYASRFINDFFDGNVEAYWKSNSRVFSPDIGQDFARIKFSSLDMDIFSMFSEEDNIISINIMQSLKKNSSTSEIWTRINYLCDLGYLDVEKEAGTKRLTYSITPPLKTYLAQENKI